MQTVSSAFSLAPFVFVTPVRIIVSGIRQEQDIFVRLIDSVSKQVRSNKNNYANFLLSPSRLWSSRRRFWRFTMFSLTLIIDRSAFSFWSVICGNGRKLETTSIPLFYRRKLINCLIYYCTVYYGITIFVLTVCHAWLTMLTYDIGFGFKRKTCLKTIPNGKNSVVVFFPKNGNWQLCFAGWDYKPTPTM